MYRLLSATFLAAAVMAHAPAIAQEAATESAPANTVVMGLSQGDTLRIREQASPTAKPVRLAENGEALRNLGCEKVQNYEWCKVETTVEPIVTGWTPARYLSGVDAGTTSATPPPSAATKIVSLSEVELPASTLTAEDPFLPEVPPVDPGFRPDPDAPLMEAAAQPRPLDQSALAPPSDADLSVRFGSPLPTGEAATAGPASLGAVRDAYGLAYLPPATSDTASSAGGDIPCARYVGQPMTRCQARVVRLSEKNSDITIDWPDGGSRVVRFRNGQPSDSDADDALRFTREGKLSMIRIGDAERFEILDTMSLSD